MFDAGGGLRTSRLAGPLEATAYGDFVARTTVLKRALAPRCRSTVPALPA